MRVGIDIRDLAFPIVGVGNVTLQVLQYMATRSEDDRYILYQYSNNEHCHSKACVRKVSPIAPYSFLKEQVYFSARTVLDRLDIFHSPIHLPPLHTAKRTKVVFTVHDLHSELDEMYFPPDMNTYFQGRRQHAIEHSDAVIVHSEFVRSKIVELCDVDENKIHVVPLSVPANFKAEITDDERQRVKDKYDLPERYVLSVGSIEPWKKVQMLIRSFLSFQKKQNENIHLVIVGREGWHKETCDFVRNASETSQYITWLDYVPGSDLPAIYSNATLFCSTSLWEGFGIIFLEAMAHGLPIVTTKHAAIPEVVGEAGVYFDTAVPQELEERFAYLLSHSDEREKLSQSSRARFQHFAKNDYGKAVYEVYEQLV